MENQFKTTLNYKNTRLAVFLYILWVSENFNKRIKKTETEFREILLEIDRIECKFYHNMNADICEISEEDEQRFYDRMGDLKNAMEPTEVTYSRLSQILAEYYRIKATQKSMEELYKILQKEHSDLV